MVVDKFNLVDFGGIDLIYSQGTEAPGLYERLHDSISVCRYPIIFNWKFNGIEIPPSYAEVVEGIGVISINGGVTVDTDDVIRILTIERVIERLEVFENGRYDAEVNVDGFNPVIVDVTSDYCEVSVYDGTVLVHKEGVLTGDSFYYEEAVTSIFTSTSASFRYVSVGSVTRDMSLQLDSSILKTYNYKGTIRQTGCIYY